MPGTRTSWSACFRASSYKAQGYENAQRWIDNSRARLLTETAQRPADELLSQGSLDWLRTALGEKPA